MHVLITLTLNLTISMKKTPKLGSAFLTLMLSILTATQEGYSQV